MAQVPYSPIPLVQPSDQGIAKPSVNAPLAAFGGATGEALSKLGSTVEKAGDEMFTRALAIQQLQNETEATQADTEYMKTAGKLHGDFNALQGQDRVLAQDKYYKDLEESRAKIRDGLSNDMARKMYDRSSMSTMGRSIFNGAGAAAAAQKDWAIGTAVANKQQVLRTVGDNYNDTKGFEDSVNQIKARTIEEMSARGVHEGPQLEMAIAQSVSQTYAKRAIEWGRYKPTEAREWADQNRGMLLDDDRKKVDVSLDNDAIGVGSAMIANEVGLDLPMSQAEDKARQLAAERSKDPRAAEAAVKAVQGRYLIDKRVQKEDERENWGTVQGAIMSSGATTVQQLRTDPQVAAAIDTLSVNKPVDVQRKINNFIKAQTAVTDDREKTRLHGMRNSTDPEIIQEFLDIHSTDLKGVSQGTMRWVDSQQAQLKKHLETNPIMSRTMAMLERTRGTELGELNIDRTKDKDKFIQFQGALFSAMEVYKDEHKRWPSDDEVLEKIFPNVARVRTPGWFTDTHVFDEPAGKDWLKANRPIVRERLGYDPTDGEMQRLYTGKLYKSLFGTKKESP